MEIKYSIDEVPDDVRDLLVREIILTHRAYTYNFDDLMLAAAILLASRKDSDND